MSLPITIAGVHHGLSDASGVVQLTDDFLEIQLRVTVMGMFKRKPLIVKIAPEAIHSVRLKRGLVRDKLIIRPWKASLLEAVPGKHEGEVELRVKRAYRDEAEILVEEVEYWLERVGVD